MPHDQISSSTERQHVSDMRVAYGHKLVETSPDNRPAAALRRLLAEDRARGLSFAEAWPDDIRAVLSRLTAREAQDWEQAFAWSQAAWRAAYDGTEGPGFKLHHDLLVDDGRQVRETSLLLA